MDPSVQSICISLLLTFALCGQERPELLRKNLDPVHLANFLANLLLTEPSTSVTLSCLLITEQMLQHHYSDYVLNFVRQGVLHAVQNMGEREEAAEKADHPIEKAEAPAGEAETERPASSSSAGCLRKLCREVAQRVNTKHFASWSLELVVLQEMKDIAQQFPKDAKTALERLRTLLLAKEGVTAFEVTCSGVSAALSAFLFPEGDEQLKEHLRLFLDHFVTPPGGALVKLVKLCVSSLQRAEQQPLMLFPTQASPAMYLPRHLSRLPLAIRPRYSRCPPTAPESCYKMPLIAPKEAATVQMSAKMSPELELFVVCGWGKCPKRLERVLKKKPNVNWKNEDGQDAGLFHSWICQKKRWFTCVVSELELRAHLFLERYHCHICANKGSTLFEGYYSQHEDGLTPLFNATMCGSADFVEKLIKAGAEPNVVATEYLLTPFEWVTAKVSYEEERDRRLNDFDQVNRLDDTCLAIRPDIKPFKQVLEVLGKNGGVEAKAFSNNPKIKPEPGLRSNGSMERQRCYG
eukprot:g3638.t1